MKNKLKSLLFILVIIGCMIFLLPQAALATAVVTSSEFTSVVNFASCHESSFIAHDRQWIFYFTSSNNIAFRSAPIEGTPWSSYTTITDATYKVADSNNYAVKFDGTYVHVAIGYAQATYDIAYRRGEPLGNGTIAWSNWQVVYDTTGLSNYYYPSVAVDVTGHPYITANLRSSGPSNTLYVWRSSTTDGTWVTDSGYPAYLMGATNNVWTSQIQAGGSIEGGTGKMVVVMACVYTTYNKLVAKRYDGITTGGGGWGAAKYTTTTTNNGLTKWPFDTVAQGDDVHTVFEGGVPSSRNNAYYAKFQYSTNSWTSETQIYAFPASVTDPDSSITFDTTNSDLHIFTANRYNNSIYYIMYSSSLASWSGSYLIEADSDGIAYSFADSPPIAARDEIGIYWACESPAIKFKYLDEPFEISTLYADGISNIYATLYGSIDSLSYGNALTRGFIYKAGSDPLDGGATTLSASGSFGTGIYYLTTLPELIPSTLYHFRALATNVFGTVYGDDTQFYTTSSPTPTPTPTSTPLPTMPPGPDCTIAPDVSTRPATYISMTTARLNALLNDDGGGETYIRFQYYASGGTWTDNETDWIGGYWDGHPNAYINISGLTGNTTYYFRAQATNPCGTDTGSSLSFITSATLPDVTGFIAIPKVDEATIDLKWSWPTGAAYTVIRYKLGEYPGNATDGALVVQQSHSKGAAYAHEDLTPGDTLYYSAWGYDGVSSYSSNAVNAIATVTLSPSSSGGTAPGAPTNWVRDVVYTNLSGMPGYGIVNWVADEFGISREFFWGALGLLIAAGVFILAYIITKGNLLPTSLATLVILAVEVPMGLNAGFIAFLWAFFTVIVIILKVRT